jgi:hypothetical protein
MSEDEGFAPSCRKLGNAAMQNQKSRSLTLPQDNRRRV